MKTYYEGALVTIKSELPFDDNFSMDFQTLGKTLETINAMVAKAFCKPIKHAIVELCDAIESRNKKRLSLCVGTCDTYSGHIQIVIRGGWQNTYIHELAHLYKPEASEKEICTIKDDLVRYLRYWAQDV